MATARLSHLSYVILVSQCLLRRQLTQERMARTNTSVSQL